MTTTSAFRTLREKLEWTQAAMAEAIGLSWRQYNDIENGRAPVRKIHDLAIERVSLHEAAIRGDPTLLFANVRAEARAVTRAAERS